MGTHEDFKQLVKLAARALYLDLPAGSEGKTVDVLDALTSCQWVREKSLSMELKIGGKMLNYILDFLQEEELIRRETTIKSKRQKIAPNAMYAGQNLIKTNSYICLDYAKVYDAVRYRINDIMKDLKGDLNNKNIVLQYMCPNCKVRYSALDAMHIVSDNDEYFHCEKCNGTLLTVDSEDKHKNSMEMLCKVKEDLKPLSLLIEKLVDVAPPDVVSLQPWKKPTTKSTNVVASTVSGVSKDVPRVLNPLPPSNKLKDLPTWIIGGNDVNVTNEEKRILIESVQDVEKELSCHATQESDKRKH